ncbi:hypothetical protein niasHT_001627 [Heterodera trifolii]|uniref:VWA N-terminal domain-containing protein n=1 Tax=Heterodera trifolii TaxID=157864 RepID=A0ABD2LNR3_9BILA
MGRHRITAAEDMETVLNRLRPSVDRFDANFQRTFNEYGRVDSVRELLEDSVVPRFTVEEHSRVDFVDAFQQLQLRLQQFFDTKIRALHRLVGAAEKAAQKVDMDKVMGPTLGSERSCRHQMRALNASSVHNPSIWKKSDGKTNSAHSGVHVALDVYKCSGAVKRDFNWTGQANIEQAMAENAQNDATLMRQYIGTYSGLTRIFPGFHWDVGPDEFSMDLFDPRFRPWFTAAESAPKDVLFLLDFSGSAKGLFVHLIKTSVMAVLQTLSPNDFFTGIWYNSRRDFVLANCTDRQRGDTFLPANSRNKLLFRRFLDRIEERDQAVLPPAIEESFAQFVFANQHQSSDDNGTAAPPRRSGGHHLVLLFTDGVEFWPTDVVHRFQQRQQAEGLPPIRVFGHSIGHGRGAQPALGWLTCQTRAGLHQAEIGSVAEVRLKARAHLAKLSEVLALAYRDRGAVSERRPISWSTPYMDVQKGGAVVSLSMPVLGAQPGIYRDLNMSQKKFADGNLHAKLDGFIAVAGLDIGFAELARAMVLDSAEDATLAYAFLVDNNGIVYFHPRLHTRVADVFAVRRTMCHRISSTLLRSNTRVPFTKADELVHQQLGYIDSVPHRDLLEVEPDTPLMRRFRARLVRRQCGIGMAPLEDAQRQLRCAAVNGTPLVVGFVLMKQRHRVSISKHHFQNEEDEVDPFQLAERFKSAGFESNGQHQQQEGTREEAEFVNKQNNNNSLAQPLVGILLSPGPIMQWQLSAALSTALRPLSRFRALLRLLPSLRHGHPFLTHLSALAPDSVFPIWASAWDSSSASSPNHRFSASTCTLRPLPPRIDPRLFRSAFLQFRASSLRDKAALAAFFPRCELKSVQAIVQRTNQRQSLAHNDDGATEIINDGKLRVEVDTMDDATATDFTLSIHKFMAVVDNSVPLVQIGVQLRANFFQQKFQRALQQHQGGWHECTNKAGRKCLLLSDSSMVLASSDPSGSQSVPNTASAPVVHLSNAEPELFAELLSRGFVQKVVWHDQEAQCPMVVTLDQRQLQRHHYLQHLHSALSDPPSSAAPAFSSSLTESILRWSTTVFSPFRRGLSLLPAALQWFGFSLCWSLLLPVSICTFDNDNAHQQPQFVGLSDYDCQFDNDQPTELMEQCTVEHIRYQLRAVRAREQDKGSYGGSGDSGTHRKDQSAAIWMRDRRCNRTIGLLPFARSHLFLLLIDGICHELAAEKESAKTQQQRNGAEDKHGTSTAAPSLLFPKFVSQKQVPNCELTRSSMDLERTLRPDLDYTLSHPKEFNPICSVYSAQQLNAPFAPYFLLFSLFISSVLIFKDEFCCFTF